MLSVAVLVSGGGTNLQALLDAQRLGEIKGGVIAHVISSQKGAFALERAKKAGVQTVTCARQDFSSMQEYQVALLDTLLKINPDLIVLAGFLTILDKKIIQAFENKIMNIHPALIPSFSGKGFYGLRVHESALKTGVKVSGATVHFVNEIPDGGAIVLQKAVDVLPNDTPETLQKRVMEKAEWTLLPQAVSLFCQGKIKVDGNIATIVE